MVNLTVRMDENLKADAEAVLERLGLTASEAVRLFFAQIRNTRSIPFGLSVGDEPNEETKKAIEDARKGIGLSRPFETAEEMWRELGI